MNLYLLIAKKIGEKEIVKGSLSSLSNTIASISVAVSILVMFMAIAVSEGFKREIKETAVGFSGEILLVAPGEDITTDQYPIGSNFSFRNSIEKIDGVRSINPVAYTPGMVKTEENVHGVYFKGVDSTYNLSFFEKYLVAGTLPNFSGKSISNDILISERLATMLGYSVGDNITAYFVGENVRARKFRISGLYSVRLEEIDKTMTIVDIRHVQRLNGWSAEEVSSVEIALDYNTNVNRVNRAIGEILFKETLDTDDSMVVKTIAQIYPNIFDWLELLNLNVFVILLLMTAVAGFNMISGLLIILFEKISMIGLLKALGMKTRNICKVFILRGAFIVLKGIVAGNIIALALYLIQSRFHIIALDPSNYFVDHVPLHMNPVTAVILNIAAFALMLLVMALPSLFIARVEPDKTIRMR